MVVFAGIGSRDIPKEYETIIVRIAHYMVAIGAKLRSGGANGTDRLFQSVFEKNSSCMEIYIPWEGFEGLYSNMFGVYLMDNPKAIQFTKKYHGGFRNLTSGSIKLHNRNAHQILGKELDDPCDLVICYRDPKAKSSGTDQAIRIALDNGIPVINVANYTTYTTLLVDVIDTIRGIV